MKTNLSHPQHRLHVVVAFALCAAVALAALGFAPAAPAKTVKVIVQGGSLADMESAVQAVGGVVTHRFTLITAVSADVPEAALSGLTDGATVQIQVSAANNAGESKACSPAEIVVPAT